MRLSGRAVPAVVLAATVAMIQGVAGAQALVTERTISATAAQEAARVALDQCRKEGHRVTVTVLDHAARTKVVLRDDGASPHSLQHSLNKAYTALTYGEPSGDYGKRAASNFPARRTAEPRQNHDLRRRAADPCRQ